MLKYRLVEDTRRKSFYFILLGFSFWGRKRVFVYLFLNICLCEKNVRVPNPISKKVKKKKKKISVL